MIPSSFVGQGYMKARVSILETNKSLDAARLCRAEKGPAERTTKGRSCFSSRLWAFPWVDAAKKTAHQKLRTHR